jgi:hypothetical protein
MNHRERGVQQRGVDSLERVLAVGGVADLSRDVHGQAVGSGLRD